MSQCRTCGNKAGAFKNQCSDCESGRIPQQIQAAYSEWSAGREAFVAESWSTMVNALRRGHTPSLLRVVPVATAADVDGAVVGSESFALLHVALLQGWEVLAVIPRTSAFALRNVNTALVGAGTEYGGGLGGNVTGAYFVLGMRVTTESIEQESQLIRSTLEAQYDKEAPPPVGHR